MPANLDLDFTRLTHSIQLYRFDGETQQLLAFGGCGGLGPPDRR
jgi:hypothetical protein